MNAHADSIDRSAPTPIRTFLVQALLWNIALFGAIRLAWIDRHVIGRLVEFQKTLAFWYGATPHPNIIVNSSCSSADVMALCAGVLLAYPLPWRRRITGAAIGIGVILTLNAIRIASLYAVATRPSTLDLLHLYVWPAIFVVATAGYVVSWLRWSDARAHDGGHRRWIRFGVTTAAALVAYVAAVPLVLTSPAVLQVGAWTAESAAAVLTPLGASVRAVGPLLVTERGAFQVTQECLFTPAIPLYLAAVVSAPFTRRKKLAWLALAVPIFFALGVARILVLALPAQVSSSPVVLAHGFYQLIAGAACIIVAAHLSREDASGQSASQRTLASLALAVATGIVTARVWAPLLFGATAALHELFPAAALSLERTGDPQGALALFPAFQLALVAGLWLALTGGRRVGRLAGAMAMTAGLQVVFLTVLGVVAAWLHVEPHALVVRGWALGVPLVFAAAWAMPDMGTLIGDRSYERFWNDVGEEFPTLTGAASTAYYFENEKRLIADALPSLAGCTLLKTDLWDEAKNTHILQWAADQGARVYGIDLSGPIAREARAAFGRRPLRPVVSDVRRLPFGDGSFDAIYSMGTIEHFAETEASVAEIARVLKPGGRLILGVPNRHDPFLRPLLVSILSRLGLYAYGYEKSYSRRALRRMLEGTGLDVQIESGILFMPGWLRMLDLWCYTRVRPLARVTAALVQPFVWFDRHLPWLRRHGYLLASVGVKPAQTDTAPSHDAARADGSPALGWHLPDVTPSSPAAHTGTEYVIDARGCDRDALRSLPRLQRLVADAQEGLGLHPLAPPLWYVFPGHGGVTGMVLLSESHLTVHTYPESGFAAINLYCCRASVEWDWEPRLRALLGASDVSVRALRRS